MRVPSAAELLDAWERGLPRPPVERALLLLAAACPDVPPDALARLSVGRRDGLLLDLREQTFGPRLAGLADCPGCRERLELSLAVADLRVRVTAEPAGELEVSAAGHVVRFRLPDSRDLAALAGSPDTAAARQRLLERCICAAQRGDEGRAVADLGE